MGTNEPFGTEGICPRRMLHQSQDRVLLWVLKVKKNVEDWRPNP